MKKLYAHIGSEKCGSTTVQVVFNIEQMRINLLQQFAIRYVPDFYRVSRQLVPFADYSDAHFEMLRKGGLEPYLDDDATESILITQEAFLGLRHASFGNVTRDNAELLKKIGVGYDIHPLVIFRRQDRFIESVYNQMVKTGETRSFQDFLQALPLDNYQWDRVADDLADCFGAEKTVMIPFEQEVLQTGKISNFIEAMFVAMNVQGSIDLSHFMTINPSLSQRAVEVQRVANRDLDSDEAMAVMEWLLARAPKKHTEKVNFFTDEERQALLERFAASNRRLFERYAPQYDPAFYVTPQA